METATAMTLIVQTYKANILKSSMAACSFERYCFVVTRGRMKDQKLIYRRDKGTEMRMKALSNIVLIVVLTRFV
jgi:hypothetical protein